MLGAALPENDRRQDYLRATLSRDSVANTGGNQAVYAFETQDSSMLSRLTQANCLIVRAPHAPALEAGETVEIIRFPSDF